jgi:DNA-binding CsgD family transcriptional regulator
VSKSRIDRLLSFLGFCPPPPRPKPAPTVLFDLDSGLIESVQELAESESLLVEDLTAELLARGLAQRGQDAQTSQRWEMLSPREQQVAALTCLGYTNRQMAARLGVSPETVRTFIIKAQRKFDVHSKADLRRVLENWDFSEFEKADDAGRGQWW